MNFIDTIISWLKNIIEFIKDGFTSLMEFLAEPLGYLFSFLDGIFYFITVLFDVVVKIIMIFTAIFQFIFAIGAGIFRTAKSFLTVNPSPNVYFPSSSSEGFATVIDVIKPTGLYDVVPMIMIALVWLGFILKMLGLFGGNIYINVNGSGGSK